MFNYLELLSFIGLTLPAIGIYLQIVYSDQKVERFNDVEAGSYHQARLAILSLLGAGIILLALFASTLFPFCSDLQIFPACKVSVDVGAVLIVLSAFGVLLILLGWIGATQRNSRATAGAAIVTAGLILISAFYPRLVVISLIGLGLVMFATHIAFERTGRKTDRIIWWGISEMFNHPWIDGRLFDVDRSTNVEQSGTTAMILHDYDNVRTLITDDENVLVIYNESEIRVQQMSGVRKWLVTLALRSTGN